MSYEKDGEKYYIVDAHSHFWDASRENWKPGREEYAKGWIDCFYGYHQLAPPETHWDYEKYLKVTPEDFEQDMFVDGYVDKVVFQSTYLYDWYTEGFNTADRNGGIKDLLPKYADRFIVNGRFDPREGEAGLKQLEEDAKKWNLKGVKVWTPKWQVEGFVDWQMPDDEAFTDYAKLTTATKKKILGLNAAKLYDIEVPAEFAVDTTADETGAPGHELVDDTAGAGAQA